MARPSTRRSAWPDALAARAVLLVRQADNTPTLDDVLLTQLGQVAKDRGDTLTWMITTLLADDSRRGIAD
jgi:hypothetical protein